MGFALCIQRFVGAAQFVIEGAGVGGDAPAAVADGQAVAGDGAAHVLGNEQAQGELVAAAAEVIEGQAAGGLRSAGGADAVVVQACVAGDEGGVLQVDGKLGIALRLPGLQGAGGGDARQVVGQQQAAFKVGRR